MALPTAQALLRSPYFVKLERANLSKIVVELYIYTGTLTTDKPADYQYYLVSDAFILENGNYFAEIDISEKCRDYIENTYSGTTDSKAVWIEYDLYYADVGDSGVTLEGSYSVTGLEGYSYPEEGYNATLDNGLLQISNTIYAPTGKAVRVPVLQDDFTNYSVFDSLGGLGGAGYTSSTYSVTENTANEIYYASTSPYPNGNVMVLRFSGASDIIINIKRFDCNINEVYKITFINKYGALQDLFFYGKTTKRTSIESTTFKRNILDGGTYSTTKHQDTTLYKQSRDTYTVNTGWYPEEMNDTIQDLFQSRQVWGSFTTPKFAGADATSTLYPLTLKTNSIQFKQRNYDKLINYTMDFEVAMDRINSIR